jgi:PAS domain S-box-containing protein
MLALDTITHLFKVSPTASLILYPDAPVYTIASVNPACLSLICAEIADINGISILDVCEELNQDSGLLQIDTLRSSLALSLASKSAAKFGVQQCGNSNKPSVIEKINNLNCNTYPLLDEDGNVAFLVLELQEAVENAALQASEQRFKALIQDGSDLIGILDNTGKYLYVNQTSQRILGIHRMDFVGKNAFDFIHEQDKERVLIEFEQLVHQKSIKVSPFRFKNNEGEYRWIESIITNMTDDPSVGGIVSNSRDVTERIENEIKIQESIERYNIVSKATSDAIWDLDATTGIVVWNKAIKAVFGYKDTIFSRSWWQDRVHPTDFDRVMKKKLSIIKAKKSRMKIEYRFRCADDSYKNVLDRSFLVYNDMGQLLRIIGSMEDVSERQLYLQTVEAQNKRLKEIAWTQSHVVRAPLSNIMAIAELLSSGVDDGETQDQLLTHLSKAAVELDAIVKDIVRKTEVINSFKEE